MRGSMLMCGRSQNAQERSNKLDALAYFARCFIQSITFINCAQLNDRLCERVQILSAGF